MAGESLVIETPRDDIGSASNPAGSEAGQSAGDPEHPSRQPEPSGASTSADAPVLARSSAVAAISSNAGRYYVASADEFKAAVAAIAASDVAEATVVFTADNVDVGKFAGIEGKQVTLCSEGLASCYVANMGTSLVGAVTFGNISCFTNSSTVYANGHAVVFAEDFVGTLGYYNDRAASLPYLYGGSKGASVASTDVQLYGGQFSSVYGGGSDGDVEGDTNVIVRFPDSGSGDYVATLHGGGLGTSSGAATVHGSTNITITDSQVNAFYGGGNNGVAGFGDRSAGQVLGSTNVVVGGASHVTQPSFAGSDHSTVGSTNLTIGGSTESDFRYCGGGASDIVKATASIVVSGGRHSSIYVGGCTTDVGFPAVVGADYANQGDGDGVIAAKAGSLLFEGGTLPAGDQNDLYAGGKTLDYQEPSQVYGSVDITVTGGSVRSVNGGGDSSSAPETMVHGNVSVSILGGTVPLVKGWSTFDTDNDSEDDAWDVNGDTFVELNGVGTSDAYYDLHNLWNVSNLRIANSHVYVNGGVADHETRYGNSPFYSVYDVQVESDSTLALCRYENKGTLATISGKFTCNGGKLVLVKKGNAPGTGDDNAHNYLFVGGGAEGYGEVAIAAYGDPYTLVRPEVGERYICAAPQGSETFVLFNDEPDLFLDNDKTVYGDGSQYDTWVIATGRVVTFDANGGDTDAVPRKVGIKVDDLDKEYTLGSLPADPRFDFHSFLGWNTKPDGTGVWFTADTPVEHSMTVYAQWREGEAAYTYQVVGEGGSVSSPSETVSVGSGVAKGSTAKAAAGYRLVGWYADEACTDLVTPETAEAHGASLSEDGATLVPRQVDGLYPGGAFYAKFTTSENGRPGGSEEPGDSGTLTPPADSGDRDAPVAEKEPLPVPATGDGLSLAVGALLLVIVLALGVAVLARRRG